MNQTKINKLPEPERCDCTLIHEEVVREVNAAMIEEETALAVANLFKAFSDGTRIKILWALKESEMCVCDIAYLLDMSQSAISHQLRQLKQVKLVKSRREGKVVYYALDDAHVQSVLAEGFEHVMEEI